MDIKLIFKKGKFKIFCNKDYEYFIQEVDGRIFDYKGLKFGVEGNSKTGYKVTHLETGVLVNSRKYKKLVEINEDIELIYNLLISNEKLIKELKEKFERSK